MIKKIIIAIGLMVVIGLLIFGAVNRTRAKNLGTESQAEVSRSSEKYGIGGNSAGQHGKGEGAGEALSSNLPASSSLDENEKNALIYMREEEKLAHDVYLALYARWEQSIFQNIIQSEQTHMQSIKALIDRYGLTDPAASAAGVFTNSDLQNLYDELVERGSQSLGDALKVGAAIEEIDILDLEKTLSQTDNADIKQVFTDQKLGSSNHLRAFTSALSNQTGEAYQPQYLSMEEYQAILQSGNGGNGRAGWGGGNKNGQR
jgi:hypothetical protein